MDLLTLLGALIGILCICLAFVLDGSHISSLLNFPALLVVLGGTISAILVQTPKMILLRATHIAKWALYPPELDFEPVIHQVVFWSKKTRQKGLLAIEDNIEKIRDPYMLHGAQLMISGIKRDALQEIMEYEIDSVESRDLGAAKVFESMGGYSPTLGILGAVIGLIHVMNNLTDPSHLGSGIAVAFIATIYGVAFANLLFIPLANRIKIYVFRRTRLYEMYLMGLMALLNGDSPKSIEMKMRSFYVKSSLHD